MQTILLIKKFYKKNWVYFYVLLHELFAPNFKHKKKYISFQNESVAFIYLHLCSLRSNDILRRGSYAISEWKQETDLSPLDLRRAIACRFPRLVGPFLGRGRKDISIDVHTSDGQALEHTE